MPGWAKPAKNVDLNEPSRRGMVRLPCARRSGMRQCVGVGMACMRAGAWGTQPKKGGGVRLPGGVPLSSRCTVPNALQRGSAQPGKLALVAAAQGCSRRYAKRQASCPLCGPFRGPIRRTLSNRDRTNPRVRGLGFRPPCPLWHADGVLHAPQRWAKQQDYGASCGPCAAATSRTAQAHVRRAPCARPASSPASPRRNDSPGARAARCCQPARAWGWLWTVREPGQRSAGRRLTGSPHAHAARPPALGSFRGRETRTQSGFASRTGLGQRNRTRGEAFGFASYARVARRRCRCMRPAHRHGGWCETTRRAVPHCRLSLAPVTRVPCPAREERLCALRRLRVCAFALPLAPCGSRVKGCKLCCVGNVCKCARACVRVCSSARRAP